MPPPPRLWWIGPPDGDIDVERCLAFGAAAGQGASDALVLLRWPERSDAAAVAAARALRRRLRDRETSMAVGVRLAAAPTPELAHAVADLDAVHLAAGCDLVAARAALDAARARCVLTFAAHDAGALLRGALADGALVSPVLATRSKPESKPLGWDRLRALTALAPTRVVALGGLKPSDAAAVVRAGAAGMAMLGAAWRDPIATHVEALAALMSPATAAPGSP